MSTKRHKPARRKPRADAQRNRVRVLEAAKQAFTRHGGNASLDDIAKDAGVGAGTLYRHFPTRDALIEAVYRTEVEKLAAAEGKFAASLPPLEALRAWMLLFVDYIEAKHIIAPALNTYAGGASKLYESSRAQVSGAIDALVKRAIQSGDAARAWLYLSHDATQTPPGEPPRLYVVTRAAQSVLTGDQVNLEQGGLRGLMRVVEPVVSLLMARQFAGYHRKLRSNLEAD